MSHHLDSPASRRDPRLNLTDVYVFDGTTGTSFVMLMNTSLSGEGLQPGFHPEARYEFKVHRGHEAHENLTYRVSFGHAAVDGGQDVAVNQLTDEDAGDDTATGTLVAQGRTNQVIDGANSNGLRLWTGVAADPFYLDLHHLSFIIKGLQGRARPRSNSPTGRKRMHPGPRTCQAQYAASSFSGSSVSAIVLEVAGSDPQLPAGRDSGVWATSKLATDAGGWRQINRAAIPMMWPLFRAIGDADDDHYARDTVSHPADDRARDGDRIVDMITAATRMTGTTNPGAYARTVTERLLPDVLPYRTGRPPRSDSPDSTAERSETTPRKSCTRW